MYPTNQSQSILTTLFGSPSRVATATMLGFLLLFAAICFYLGLYLLPELKRRKDQKAYLRSLEVARASLRPSPQPQRYAPPPSPTIAQRAKTFLNSPVGATIKAPSRAKPHN